MWLWYYNSFFFNKNSVKYIIVVISSLDKILPNLIKNLKKKSIKSINKQPFSHIEKLKKKSIIDYKLLIKIVILS